MLDRTGQQVGPYRLIRLLGASPFGEVYFAEHTQTRATSAVKVLKLQLPPETLPIFINEAQASKLQQAHILRLLDLGVAGDIPFLVMDYTPNGSLRQRFPRSSRVPLELVGNYLQQIAQALQFAHMHGLTHRNVKPENMLVWQENYILLSDFSIGIVDHLQRSLNRPEMAVNLPYIAPEQIQGRAQPATDQYALAAVMYEWLCGIPPFQGTSAEMIAQKLSATPLPLRTFAPALPGEAEMVVMQALARDPQARFPSVEAFEQAFNKAMTERALPQINSAAPGAASAAPIVAPIITPPTPPKAEVIAETPASEQPIEDDRTQIDEKIGERIRTRNNALKENLEQAAAADTAQQNTQKYASEEPPTQISSEIGEQIQARKDMLAQAPSTDQPLYQAAPPVQNSTASGTMYNPTSIRPASMPPQDYKPAQVPDGGPSLSAFLPPTAPARKGRKIVFILIIIILIILIIVGLLILFPAILHKL